MLSHPEKVSLKKIPILSKILSEELEELECTVKWNCISRVCRGSVRVGATGAIASVDF